MELIKSYRIELGKKETELLDRERALPSETADHARPYAKLHPRPVSRAANPWEDMTSLIEWLKGYEDHVRALEAKAGRPQASASPPPPADRTVLCPSCKTRVSTEAILCFACGTRLR